MLPAFLATILFSLSAVSAYRSARLVGGVEANFWRLAVATACLALWAHTAGGGLGGDALSVFIVSGFIGIGLGDVAFYEALPLLGARLATLLLQCFSTPFAMVIERAMLGTKLSSSQVVAALVTLAGVSLALAPAQHIRPTRRQMFLGVTLTVVASLCNAAGMVLSRKAFAVAAAAGQQIDGGTAAYQRLFGGVFVAAVFLLLARRKAIQSHVKSPTLFNGAAREKWLKVWPWVLLNSLAGMTLGVSCLQWALKTTPTGVVLPIVALTPLVVIPFARKFEGERPTRRSLIGGVIAVAGTIALTLASLKPEGH